MNSRAAMIAAIVTAAFLIAMIAAGPAYALKVYVEPSTQLSNHSPDHTYVEAYGMQDVAVRLDAMLRARGFDTRDGNWLYLPDANTDAWNWGAQCMVALHSNAAALPDTGWHTSRGSEGYYKNCNGVYDPNDYDIADRCANRMVAKFGELGRGYDRGTYGDCSGYMILNSPGHHTLVESLFHDNVDDLAVLRRDNGRDYYAQAIYEAICDHYGWSRDYVVQQMGIGSVGIATDGRMEFFAIGSNGHIYHTWQSTIDSTFSAFYDWGQNIFPSSKPYVARNANRELSVFVRDKNGNILRMDHSSGGWSGWQNMGGSFMVSDPCVGMNLNGCLELFARGADNALWHCVQTSPSGGWGSWTSCGGYVQGNPGAGRFADGRLAIFVRDSVNTVWYYSQTSPGTWGGWHSTGAGSVAGDPQVAKDRDGRIEIVARRTDNAIVDIWESAINADSWGSASVGGSADGNPCLGTFADGRLYAFYRDSSSHAIYEKHQNSPNSSWSSWASLGGVGTGSPIIGRQADGRVQFFVRGGSDHMYTQGMTIDAHNGGALGWSGFTDLGGSFMSEDAMTTPTTPTATATTTGTTTVNVSWTTASSSDGSGINNYEVYRNDAWLTNVYGATSFADSGLSEYTQYTYKVRAISGNGLVGAFSGNAGATTWSVPSAPTASASATGPNTINIAWTAASNADGSGIANYEIYRNGASLTTVSGATGSFGDSNLAANTQYTYKVRAKSGNGVWGAFPSDTSATTYSIPTVPGNVVATSGDYNISHVTWNASSDPFGISSYEIWRNGAALTTVGSGVTSFDDSNLTQGTTYTYQVRAKNTQNVWSALSTGFGVKTWSVLLNDPFSNLSNWTASKVADGTTRGVSLDSNNGSNLSGGSGAPAGRADVGSGGSNGSYAFNGVSGTTFAVGYIECSMYDSATNNNSRNGIAFRKSTNDDISSPRVIYFLGCDGAYSTTAYTCSVYGVSGGWTKHANGGTRSAGWHRFRVGIDGTNVKFFVDGTLKDTIAEPAEKTDGVNRWYIGNNYNVNYVAYYDDFFVCMPTPPTPSPVSASNITSTSITWNFTEGPSDFEQGFYLRDTGGALKGTGARNATSITETGLSPNTTYYRTISAYNGTLESAVSIVVSATTAP